VIDHKIGLILAFTLSLAFALALALAFTLFLPVTMALDSHTHVKQGIVA
jgi:hypothetical protein